jgi:hypothetical protein
MSLKRQMVQKTLSLLAEEIGKDLQRQGRQPPKGQLSISSNAKMLFKNTILLRRRLGIYLCAACYCSSFGFRHDVTNQRSPFKLDWDGGAMPKLIEPRRADRRLGRRPWPWYN